MIPQGYPLYAVNNDGELYVVVGWRADSGRPMVVSLSSYSREIGARVYNDPLRYYLDFSQAQQNSHM